MNAKWSSFSFSLQYFATPLIIATFSAMPSPVVNARCLDLSFVAFSNGAASRRWYTLQIIPARVIGRFSPGFVTVGTLGMRDVAPFLKSSGGTPDSSHKFIWVVRSSRLMVSTCDNLMRSGPGAPFFALRRMRVTSDVVTTFNRSSFNWYALGGVLESATEGDSSSSFQKGMSWSIGRLLVLSFQVPRIISFAVSDCRSPQSLWSFAYFSRFACLLLAVSLSSFLDWAALCPFWLLTLFARNFLALGALCLMRSSNFESHSTYSFETMVSHWRPCARSRKVPGSELAMQCMPSPTAAARSANLAFSHSLGLSLVSTFYCGSAPSLLSVSLSPCGGGLHPRPAVRRPLWGLQIGLWRVLQDP